jgi:UDP-glucose 6-dehydrogenase
MKTKYSIIGLGKLGASMAAGIASRGFEVIGVDVNENAVRLLNDGHAPAQETGLDDLVAANKERLKGTMSHREAVLGSNVSFVIVPTPSNQEGGHDEHRIAGCDTLWTAASTGRSIGEEVRSRLWIVLHAGVHCLGKRDQGLPQSGFYAVGAIR